MDLIRITARRIADLARSIIRAEGIRPQAAILRAGVRLAAEAGWRLVVRIDERPAGGRVTSVPEARRAVVYLGLEASVYTAAHEVGHAVLEALGHPSQLPGARGDECERAAWRIAAVVVARLGCHPDPEERVEAARAIRRSSLAVMQADGRWARGAEGLTLVSGNPDKARDLARLGLPVTGRVALDLPEVLSGPTTVATYKAAMAWDRVRRPVVVEDTSLDVQGADVGVSVRWLLDRLGELAGRRAWWRVTLAVCDGRVVRIYQARVAGWIVPSRGRGWGWDPVYVPGPDPRRWTMAEWRDMAGGPPAGLDARARAVAALIAGRVTARVRLPLPAWRGAWQH